MIDQTSTHHTPDAPAGAAPQAVPLTALLVEDDTLVAMVVEEGLRDLGFEPHTAVDAAAATAALAAGLNPALAVIDVGLPDERGDKLALRLRGLYPTLPIIIASGYDELELRARFSADGGITVLGKPYTESDLAGAVRALGLET
jgi:DNA-binding response OmpR family regulator